MLKIKELASFSSSKPLKNDNEDSYLTPIYDNEQNIIFGIADGVGSHVGASKISLLTIKEILNESHKSGFNIDEVFAKIKNKITLTINETDELSNAATTLTLVHVKSDEIIVGHIGDCRLYYKNNKNKLEQLTKDHTRYQELLDSGEYSKKKINENKYRLSSVLTSAISKSGDFKYDVLSIQTQNLNISDSGLFLYVMSDGAYKHWEKRPKFSDKTMSSILAFSSSLKKRIDRNVADDDHSLIALHIEL